MLYFAAFVVFFFSGVHYHRFYSMSPSEGEEGKRLAGGWGWRLGLFLISGTVGARVTVGLFGVLAPCGTSVIIVRDELARQGGGAREGGTHVATSREKRSDFVFMLRNTYCCR